jgi:hypothetical protein
MSILFYLLFLTLYTKTVQANSLKMGRKQRGQQYTNDENLSLCNKWQSTAYTKDPDYRKRKMIVYKNFLGNLFYHISNRVKYDSGKSL